MLTLIHAHMIVATAGQLIYSNHNCTVPTFSVYNKEESSFIWRGDRVSPMTVAPSRDNYYAISREKCPAHKFGTNCEHDLCECHDASIKYSGALYHIDNYVL
jgi:hypothetical protein